MINFSLIDDGQVLIQNGEFLRNCLWGNGCASYIAQIFELGTNRFRPIYWIINSILYLVLGKVAVIHHIFRVYVLGGVIVASMLLILKNAKVGYFGMFISTFILVSNISFTENIIRLGTNEPWQILFLSLFSLVFLKKGFDESKTQKYLATILFLSALMVKESTIALVAPVILTQLIFKKGHFHITRNILVIPITILILGMLVTAKFDNYELQKGMLVETNPDYVSNYNLNPLILANNSMHNVKMFFNSTMPFPKLIIILFVLGAFFIKMGKRIALTKDIVYWCTFTFAFLAILFPWKYVLDRYQLLAVFGLSILCGIVFSRLIDILLKSLKLFQITIYRFIFFVCSFVFINNLLFLGFPLNYSKTVNFRDWFSVFVELDHDQVAAINKTEGLVYINGKDNINNWEVLFEIPIHLRLIFQNENPNVKILKNWPINEGYIFSRVPFDSVVPPKEITLNNYVVVDAKSYSVKQIDTLKFRDRFSKAPIQTIINPPMLNEGLDYYWEIRQLR